jgi:hypothetical protein
MNDPLHQQNSSLIHHPSIKKIIHQKQQIKQHL